MEPGTDFDGVFYVKNTGTITWLKSDVDYVYVVGSDFAKHDVYYLPKDVAPGETVKLTVDFLAPYARGDRYVTEWQLKWGKKYWCLMDINIYIPAGPSPTPTGPSR
jgi:hypothetical protein